MSNYKYNEYYKEHYKKNYKRISLILSLENDKDILKALDDKNIQGSIKRLIRKAIAG